MKSAEEIMKIIEAQEKAYIECIKLSEMRQQYTRHSRKEREHQIKLEHQLEGLYQLKFEIQREN